jgi:phospholipid/cholesterol/gamma-HCH transport system substrate-binding protein
VERRAQFLLVAVFLLLTLAGLFWFVRWISPEEAGSLEQRLVQFEGSVSGLSVGSEVRYLGVPVGRVLAIGLSRERTGRVDVTIGLDEILPDADRLVGVLEPQGITGLSLVELRDRGSHLEAIEVDPGVIAGKPSVFATVSVAAQRTVEQTNVALARISELLDAQTVENVQATIAQLRTLTGNLARASGDVDALIANLNRVSIRVEEALPDYSALAVRLEGELIPTLVTTGDSLQTTSNEMTRMLGENQAAVNRALQQDLPALVELGDEFSQTLQELRRLMATINNQPGALLYGSRVTETEIPLD